MNPRTPSGPAPDRRLTPADLAAIDELVDAILAAPGDNASEKTFAAFALCELATFEPEQEFIVDDMSRPPAEPVAQAPKPATAVPDLDEYST